MRHTPGPWIREGAFVYALEDSQDRWGRQVQQNRFWLNVYGQGTASEDELAANARLIAAAPDLLEAAEAAYKQLCYEGDWTRTLADLDACHKLRLAIEKAKGNPDGRTAR